MCLLLENEGVAEQIAVINKPFEEGADRSVIYWMNQTDFVMSLFTHAKKGDIIQCDTKSRYDKQAHLM